MSTDLTTTPVTVVNRRTGEALTLDSPTADLGAWIAYRREEDGLRREEMRAVTQEILRRQDREASWTTHIPGFKLTGQSPAPVEEWDGADLRAALLELVDAGVLSIEAVDAAVETVVTFKPVKKGINALRKLGGEVAETVDGLAREVDRERRVTVSRAA